MPSPTVEVTPETEPSPGHVAGPRSEPTAVLVRHGETPWSASLRHTGRSDIPLDAEGEAEAHRLAAGLRQWSFTRVLVSPLTRARQTCALAGFGDVAEVVPDLVEWDYGDYEGRTTADIKLERPSWSLWADGVPSGETLAELGMRADRVVVDIRAGGGEVAVFSHGHFLRVLAARWVGLGPEGGALLALDAGGVGRLGWEHENAVVTLWNLTF